MADGAERRWDEIDVEQVRSVAWLSVDAVTADIWRSFGGGPDEVIQKMLAERGLTDGLVGAALVCGDMQSERGLFEFGAFREVHGYDLSRVSLDRYQPDGIEWVPHHVDCNQLELPESTFDLIVASHGAHHVRELDNLFGQARRALKPGGLFFMYEWIGPPYLYVPRRNQLAAAALLLALFPRRSTRTTHENRVKGLRWVMEPTDPAADPSEACNSLELHGAYRRHFHPLREHLHGAITYPMFEGISQNLDQADPWTARRLQSVTKLDGLLTRRRLVHPLFVVTVGTPLAFC